MVSTGYVLYDPETELFLGTKYGLPHEQIWIFYWDNGPVTERSFEVMISTERTRALWDFLGKPGGDIMNRAIVVPFVCELEGDMIQVSHIHSIPLVKIKEEFWIYA